MSKSDKIIRVEAEVHRRLKAKAALNGVSLRAYLQSIIEKDLEKKKQ